MMLNVITLLFYILGMGVVGIFVSLIVCISMFAHDHYFCQKYNKRNATLRKTYEPH